MRPITTFITLLMSLLWGGILSAQERIYRYPDVSDDQIVFSFANDLWLVPRTGGQAVQLSSPEGPETFPRFSPEGNTVAFSGNYDGNTDIYTLPVAGGLPQRLTHHGKDERVITWYPSGDSILMASAMHSGKQRFNQFYSLSAKGGLPRQLPLEQAEFGSLSQDGSKLAFTYKSRLHRTWKRYQGGMAADIFIFDLNTYASENITNSDFNDELPMWHGNTIYYLSDKGKGRRYNIWAYDLTTKSHNQITHFQDFDIHYPELGPKDIVFEAGGAIYLLHLADNKYEKVPITLIDDYEGVMPRLVKVKELIQNVWPSLDGQRALVEARGEIFSLPAEKGVVKNLTHSSGSAERYPAWSPDGRKWAYWSDKSGEYQIYTGDFKSGEIHPLTQFENGFGYQLFWSPDGKKIAFVRQDMNIHWIDVEEGKIYTVDHGKYLFQGGLDGFEVSWSPDSRYMTYSRSLSNRQNAIFIYDTQKKIRTQVTSGFYNSDQPAFSDDGEFLVLRTNQRFSPTYSSFDNSWVYVNSSQLALIPLNDDVKSPFLATNDTVTIKDEEGGDEGNGGKKTEKEQKDSMDSDTLKIEPSDADSDTQNKDNDSVEITLDGLEQNMIILPIKPGNVSQPAMSNGKVFYMRYPLQGQDDESTSLQYFDLEKEEETTVITGIQFYQFTADGKEILTGSRQNMGFITPGKGQKLEKTIPLDEMQMWVDPRKEWKQIFREVWRIERDYFYDPDMHGVDWEKVGEKYGSLVDEAYSRSDINYLIGELIGELNASHTYRSGGDLESSKKTPVGYLGINWGYDDGAYFIKKIIRPANWDTEVRSPLDAPGLNVGEGDYILSANGIPLNTYGDPFAAFAGLAGQTVALEISDNASGNDSRTIYVETMKSEDRLRNLAWIEKNRQYVEDASDGQIGYIYVPSTGLDGQKELVRMFYGQIDKKALIIDERFNNGGQIPDRFIEILNRPVLAYWDVRDGETWSWPPTAHFGPKAMLINGWSGSGGDAFPDYFRKAQLGPLIGTKTWGGLIGITGTPTLIDGGHVTAPTFRMYNPDQTWFAEGHGVEPDIVVPEDPTALAQDKDPQLDAAIHYLLEQIRKNPYKEPTPPEMENRN